MNTQTIVDAITTGVFAQKNTPNVEMEIRLGKSNGSFFDTNIGAANFDKIINALEQFDGWEEKKNETTEVFYYNESKKRLTWHEDADRMIEKYRRSYIRKNLSIDMTIISGDSTDMDDEDGKKYQVELEIIDPSMVEDEPKLFNIVHKVFDVLKILA